MSNATNGETNQLKRFIYRCLRGATLAVMCLGPQQQALASSTLPLDLTRLVAGARDIAHVRCVSNTTQRDPGVGVITLTTFVVFDRAKGAANSTYTLRQAGGEIDGVKLDYHVPKFRVGDEYVLFVPAASRLGLASPLGLGQGVFGVSPSVGTPSGKEVGNGRDFAELVTGVAPSAIPSGLSRRLQLSASKRDRVDLGDFMSLVRAKAAER